MNEKIFALLLLFFTCACSDNSTEEVTVSTDEDGNTGVFTTSLIEGVVFLEETFKRANPGEA